MTGKQLSSICLLLALGAGGATGQPLEQPAGGGGDASISGRVLTGAPPAPLAGAVVNARATEGEFRTSAITDRDGRYSLTDLPDGRYTVTAYRGGYVTPDDEQATTVQVGAGEALTPIDLHLARGAVVTGIVTDRNGQPAVGARVEALRYRFRGGRREMRSAGLGDSADDRGMYRLYGLFPGEYYVVATTGFSRALMAAGAVAGSSSPTYYPNTTDLRTAQRLSLGIGAERVGVDITLATAHTGRVSGQVVDSQGRPLIRGSVRLIGRNPPGLSSHAGAVEPDGSFVVEGVPPGEYVLYTVTAALNGPIEFATMDLETTVGDVDQVVLRMTTGATAAGRIAIDGSTAVPFRPQDLQLYTVPVGFVDVPVGLGVGQVSQDWSFAIHGIGEGQLIRLLGLPQEWTLRAVLLDGRDVTDQPLDLPAGETTAGFTIEVTNRTTRFRATIVDDTGQPVTGARVVIFSADPARWQYPSRFVRTVRSDQNGIIDVRGLPAEDYLTFAANGIASGAETDTQFLERLRPAATAVTLGAGEMRELSIPLSEIP